MTTFQITAQTRYTPEMDKPQVDPSLLFKVGDRVRLSKQVEHIYRAKGPDAEQGAGGHGTVIYAYPRGNDYSRPYLVRWDSAPASHNSYREADLVLVDESVKPEEPKKKGFQFTLVNPVED
jgi:hypothetical protein